LVLATKGFFGECQNNSGEIMGIDRGTISRAQETTFAFCGDRAVPT
jgi:hypothetical protein